MDTTRNQLDLLYHNYYNQKWYESHESIAYLKQCCESDNPGHIFANPKTLYANTVCAYLFLGRIPESMTKQFNAAYETLSEYYKKKLLIEAQLVLKTSADVHLIWMFVDKTPIEYAYDHLKHRKLLTLMGTYLIEILHHVGYPLVLELNRMKCTAHNELMICMRRQDPNKKNIRIYKGIKAKGIPADGCIIK